MGLFLGLGLGGSARTGGWEASCEAAILGPPAGTQVHVGPLSVVATPSHASQALLCIFILSTCSTAHLDAVYAPGMQAAA